MLAPLDNVPLHGPVPVTAIDSVVEPPLQIVAAPVITPVGRVRIVTTGVPVKSAAIELQLASLKVAMVYDVFEVGETVILGATPPGVQV